MSNVIVFPRPAARDERQERDGRVLRSMTLFLHVRRVTMIVHLGRPQATAGAPAGGRARNP